MQWLASITHRHPQPVPIIAEPKDDLDEDRLLAEVREKIERARQELVRAEEFRRIRQRDPQ